MRLSVPGVVLVLLMAALLMGIGAGPANAARIANYGYDWKAAPFYDGYADLFDA